MSPRNDSHQDPDQLEREVEQQRREINETMQALEDKFSSREIFNQASHYMQEHGREFAESFGNSIKANPLPVAITAIGLLWMMIGQRTPTGPQPSARTGKFRQAGAQLKEGASAASDEASQTARHLRERAGEARRTLSEQAQHARESLSHSRERMEHALQGSRGNMEHLLHDQPMATGAIGIALGALLGAALPRTTTENRMFGKVGDEARNKAAQLAEQGYQKASELGESVGKQALQASKSESPQGENRPPSQQHRGMTSPASRGPSASPYP